MPPRIFFPTLVTTKNESGGKCYSSYGWEIMIIANSISSVWDTMPKYLAVHAIYETLRKYYQPLQLSGKRRKTQKSYLPVAARQGQR